MIDYGSSQSKKQYTRRIGDNGFLGADFSTAPIFASDRRFRDLKNVWKDYKSGSGVAIETVPGYRVIENHDLETNEQTINGIFRYTVSFQSGDTLYDNGSNRYNGDWVGIHHGKELKFIRVADGATIEPEGIAYQIIAGTWQDTRFLDPWWDDEVSSVSYYEGTFSVLPNKPSFAYQSGNSLIIFCNGSVYEVCPSSANHNAFNSGNYKIGFLVTQSDNNSGGNIYVPTTYIDGVPYEQKNMLTVISRERFHAKVAEISTGVYGIEVVFHERIPKGDSPYLSNIGIIPLDFDSWEYEDITAATDTNYVTGLSIGGFASTDVGTDVTFEIWYKSDPTKFSSYIKYEGYEDATTFNEGNPSYNGTAYDAIAGCTICTTFDERVFLAGNPKLPNTIFYSQRDLTGYNNATYFGVLNYNNLGTSNAPITAMIPSANALYVLKDDSATDPTMYVLSGLSTEKDLIPRIYTVESGLPGIGCKGAACNFLDDIVFISRNGVIGIDKQAVNLERTLGDRSALINGKLLLEDVTQAVFAEAEGYLWCLFKNNGHLYLADSRTYTQGAGYEWYFIDSVGSWESTLANPEVDYLQYKDDIVGDEESVTIYDEDDTEHLTPYVVLPRHTDGAQALDGNGDPITSGATYTVNPDGVTHDIILVENPDSNHTGTYFQVEKTGEKIGGTFHPATCMVASNDRIFFGTDNGDLLTFNNDKRGVQSESEIVSGTTYGENRYPFMLRPEWYSFCGHRIESFVETSDDDGGIGNLTKDTVRRSVVVDMKAMLGSKYKITTYTDRDGWKNDNAATGSMNDASQTMLDAVNFSGDEHINVQIRERARKWVHKRYRIESNGFRSPFGLYRITYNFEINGRIK